MFLQRYIDDTFLLFKEESHIEIFLEYLNNKHRNITFTCDRERDKCLSFLDVNVTRVSNHFETNVFRKKTFTGLGMNFQSFIPLKYKRNLIMCLVHRAYSICSNYIRFCKELDFLRNFFLINGFPLTFIENTIRIKLNNIFIHKQQMLTVPPKILYLKIPFYGTNSYKLKRKITQMMKKYFPQVNLRVILTNENIIGKMFRFKDRLPSALCSGVVYRYSCGSCSATYVGKTQRHFKTRISEHKGISVRTGQPLSTPLFSNIRDHAWEADHRINDGNFEIITRSNNNIDLHILESLAILHYQPTLNECNPGSLLVF